MNSDEDRFPILLRGAWFGMNKAFRERISGLGLTTSQYTILRSLSENPGISQEVLCKMIGGNKNNASALVKRMVSSGLIDKKKRNDDKRTFALYLSENGEGIFEEAVLLATTLRQNVLSKLPTRSEEELIYLLNKCTDTNKV
jgi:DNA-binding MarR family transcriptional regulator